MKKIKLVLFSLFVSLCFSLTSNISMLGAEEIGEFNYVNDVVELNRTIMDNRGSLVVNVINGDNVDISKKYLEGLVRVFANSDEKEIAEYFENSNVSAVAIGPKNNEFSRALGWSSQKTAYVTFTSPYQVIAKVNFKYQYNDINDNVQGAQYLSGSIHSANG